jgi:hypothetical protein
MTDINVLTPSYRYARFIVDGIEIESYWGRFRVVGHRGFAGRRRGSKGSRDTSEGPLSHWSSESYRFRGTAVTGF